MSCCGKCKRPKDEDELRAFGGWQWCKTCVAAWLGNPRWAAKVREWRITHSRAEDYAKQLHSYEAVNSTIASIELEESKKTEYMRRFRAKKKLEAAG